MKVYLKRKRDAVEAVGIYDVETKTLTVKKGSIVSERVQRSYTFRRTDLIEWQREQYVTDGKVKKDVVFTSPSTAANFICGSSTNGMLAWKDADGHPLREII